MSYVIAAPEMMTSAATDLAGIGSALSEAHAAAAARTVALVPAAADEVSAAVTSFFSGHAQAFHGLAGKAAACHDQFVATLKASAASYAGAEAAAAAALKPALTVPFPPYYQWFLQQLHPVAFPLWANIEAAIASFLQTLTADVNGFVSTVVGIAERIPANLQALFSIIVQNPGLFIGILVELPFLILAAPIWIPLAIILLPFLAVFAAA